MLLCWQPANAAVRSHGRMITPAGLALVQSAGRLQLTQGTRQAVDVAKPYFAALSCVSRQAPQARAGPTA